MGLKFRVPIQQRRSRSARIAVFQLKFDADYPLTIPIWTLSRHLAITILIRERDFTISWLSTAMS